MTKKIAIKAIEIERVEGPTAECKKRTVKNMNAANRLLWQWSFTAPEKGRGYDKCDFTITFADGETYSGRYDMQKGLPDGGLNAHVQSNCLYMGGLFRPAHRTEKQYREDMQSWIASGVKIDDYRDFLAKYDLGADVVPVNIDVKVAA